MPTTSTFNLPYPSLTDAPNGPSQFQALATATETAITTRTVTLIQSGSVNVTPVANVYTTAAVTFPVAFSAPPMVTVTQVAAGAGSVTAVGSDTPTASGFNAGVTRTNTTVTALMWIAVGPR